MKKMEDSTCWHLTESAVHIIISEEIKSMITRFYTNRLT
jgi:hypothetical protein